MGILLTLQTYLLPIAAAAAKAGNTGTGDLNLTVLLAIITVTVGTMGTLIGIYGRKSKISDTPCEENLYCKNEKKDIDRIEKGVQENSEENKELRELIHDIQLALNDVKAKNENMSCDMKEMKENRREEVLHLEGLVGQLSSYVQD
jgi:hypothetical protein